jgi:hypothetical protein
MDHEGPAGTHRWVKVFGAAVLVVLLLFVVLLVARGPDGHGPGRHSLGSGSPHSTLSP